MRTLRTIAEMRAATAALRSDGRSVGLVPTMGALHEGHISLLHRAAEECDAVVMSLFVNPAQFGAGEDLERYPRDEGRDAALAAGAGVSVLFAPGVTEMYPEGFATTVAVRDLSETLEGAVRGPEHFEGVATIVTKLLNIVAPDVAYFGRKDAQQALVIERLVRDLAIPVRIEVCPTIREPDGLAMSSRNAYLGPDDRARAVGLHRALTAAERAVADGERDPARVRAAAAQELSKHQIEPDYLELVSPTTLAPAQALDDGPVLVAVAARVGPARLIDNTLLTPHHRK